MADTLSWTLSRRFLHLVSNMRKPVLFSLLLIAVAVPAQEAQWCQIEVIVFARNTLSAGATEYWPEDPGTPSVTQAQSLLDSGAGNEAYSQLSRSELSLDALYGGLVASRGHYEPLLYLGWRQPVADERQAVLVYLGTGPGSAGAPPQLEGTLKVSGGRYLDAELDLLLTRLEQDAPRAVSASNEGAPRRPAYRSYRMRDHRRMRSGELHYIDHPLMGVLLLVKPHALPGTMEEPGHDQEEQGDTAPPGDD